MEIFPEKLVANFPEKNMKFSGLTTLRSNEFQLRFGDAIRYDSAWRIDSNRFFPSLVVNLYILLQSMSRHISPPSYDQFSHNFIHIITGHGAQSYSDGTQYLVYFGFCGLHHICP